MEEWKKGGKKIYQSMENSSVLISSIHIGRNWEHFKHGSADNSTIITYDFSSLEILQILINSERRYEARKIMLDGD